MPLLTSFANVFVFLSVAAGVPQTHALAADVHIGVPSSTRDAAFVRAPMPEPGPAQSKATEDDDRIEVATDWKSVQSDLAIVPKGLVLPSIGPTAKLSRRIVPFRASAASSSYSVRGPPVAP